jgi:hypothetical protein
MSPISQLNVGAVVVRAVVQQTITKEAVAVVEVGTPVLW